MTAGGGSRLVPGTGMLGDPVALIGQSYRTGMAVENRQAEWSEQTWLAQEVHWLTEQSGEDWRESWG